MSGTVDGSDRCSTEDGFTLIELLIAGALMSLIAILVSTTVIGGLRTATLSERRTDDASAAQLVLLQLNADMRAAEDVFTAGPDTVTLTTRSTLASTGTPESPVETVTYDVSGTGDLVVTRAPSGGSPLTRTVLKALAPSASAGRPVFRFLSRADMSSQCATGPTVSSLGAIVTGANLKQIYSIDVYFSVNSAPTVNKRPLVLSGGSVISSRTVDFGTVTPSNSSLGIGQGC